MTARRLALALPVLVLGCTLGEDDRAPALPGPGGSQGGTGGGEEGGGDGDGDAGVARIRGNLCRITDLRFFETCTPGDLSGIDVALLGAPETAVLTDRFGAFSLPDPGDPVTLIVGTGSPDIRNSLFDVPPIRDGTRGSVFVPTVVLRDWLSLVDSLGVVEPFGTSTVAVFARERGLPLSGVDVIGPAVSQPPFFDAGSALDWSQLGLTGDGGAALIFGINEIGAGTTPITMIDASGRTINLRAPVADGALGFSVGRFGSAVP